MALIRDERLVKTGRSEGAEVGKAKKLWKVRMRDYGGYKECGIQ